MTTTRTTTLKETLQMTMPPPLKRSSVMFADPDRMDDDDKNSTTNTILSSHNTPADVATSIIAKTTSNTSTTSLTHLQQQWPGQTGNGRHLDVRPMSFDTLLCGEHNIVIPLFQRRYCWTQPQIEQWWKDVNNAGSGGQQHSTHKTMFKKEYDTSTNTTTLICIDGQQRLTTTTLLLIALRGEARRHNVTNLVDRIDAVLLPNADAILKMKRWAKYQALQLIRNNSTHNNDDDYSFLMPSLPSGWLPPFDTILTPSYIDRAAYYEIICKDYVLEELEYAILNSNNSSSSNSSSSSDSIRIELQSSESCQESVQYLAYDIFSTELRRLGEKQQSNTSSATTTTLRKLYRNQLLGFSMMYIELLTNDNVQQIFLWMQEKTVFGMGRLLENKHPGRDFTAVDLARNLVISCVMNLSLEEQVIFYQRCWIVPLEQRFGTEGVSQILYHLVDYNDTDTNNANRYVGDMEQKLELYKAATPIYMKDTMYGMSTPMMVYARFHSYVQERAMTLENDPNAITKHVADSIVTGMIALGETMNIS